MEEVCRNLRTPYFKVSMNTSNVAPLYGVANASCQLSIPACFIKEHGDKMQLRVTLQAEASGRVWPVKLWTSAVHGKVLITSGWKEFASSNELEKGDHLIFSLTTMSQFVVYIFDVFGALKEPQCSPTSYNSCNNCQDCIAWNKFFKSEKFGNNQSEEAISSGAATDPSFKKILTITSMGGRGPLAHQTEARLELPWDFVRLHEHQLREVVKLQGPGGYHVLAVKKYRQFVTRAYFRGTGWRLFLERNSLKEGDELLFTLVATSCFAVEIDRRSIG